MNLARVKELVLVGLDLLLGLRKFLIMAALLVSGIAFLISGKISGREFVDLLQATTVSFMAANSVEKVGDVVAAFINKKA